MSFEKLRVYQAAELLDDMVNELCAKAKGHHSREIGQLKDSSGSIGANISEAYGADTPGRKKYFLGISRASSDETRDHMRRLAKRGAFEFKDIEKPSNLTRTIAKMLTSWMDGITE